MAETTMESKINELEARYRAAAASSSSAEVRHPFRTTSVNSPQLPRRPRLFDDFLVVKPCSPPSTGGVPEPPLSAPTTMHDTSLINDFRFHTNSSSLARSDIIPSLPLLTDDASSNSFTSMTASWTGPPSRTVGTQIMQNSQLVNPGTGSLSSSVPFLNMQTNVVSPQTRVGILKTPSSCASPIPNTSSFFPAASDCSRFDATPGYSHRSGGLSSGSNSNFFCPISKPTSINGTNSDHVPPPRPHLELSIASGSSPIRASRAGLDFSALRTCSPVVATRTRVDSGEISAPSPSPSSGVSRIGSDYKTPSSGSPISGSFCRSGQDFRIMSSSSPSPGSASRSGSGFRMSSSSSPSPSVVTGLDFKPSGSPSPITKSGFDFSSTSLSQSPSTNGTSAIRSGLDFKTPTPSPSHTSSGEWFSGRRRSNVASTPSPLEFGNSRPGITSSPGGGMSLVLNGQPRRRHALNLACSPQTPKALDSAEIDLKYLEIIKQSGILTIDGHRIPADILELAPLGDLGHGTCGHVVKMIHRTTAHVMAVKQMQRSGSCEDNKRIIMDLDVVIKSHSCPYIVKCIGTFITSSDVWICMELMATCLDKLLKRLAAPIPEFILGKVTVATVSALHYLKENHGVIHRDVKPSNILLDERGRIKLCDFGISGRLVDSKAKTRSAGCTAYMSPERIDPPDPLKPDYDIRADVWSLGLSLVELATGEFPYKNCSTDFEVLTKVLQDDPPSLPSGKGFSMDFSALVRACLTKDYRRRPKYQQLLEHNFVRRYTSLNVDVAAWYARITKSFEAPQAES